MLQTLLADADEFLAHPMVVPIAVALILGALAWVGRMVRSILRVSQQVTDHVLPHFISPGPDHVDKTVPARLARLEAGTEEVRRDLLEHMTDEVSIREKDLADRQSRQDTLDQRLADGADSMAELRAGQRDLAEKFHRLTDA